MIRFTLLYIAGVATENLAAGVVLAVHIGQVAALQIVERIRG